MTALFCNKQQATDMPKEPKKPKPLSETSGEFSDDVTVANEVRPESYQRHRLLDEDAQCRRA